MNEIKPLELRFYKFKELKKLLNVKRNGTVSDLLTEWGYLFDRQVGEGILIHGLPDPTDYENQLRELVMRKYKKTLNFNIKHFAAVLYLMQENPKFTSAPYQTKANILKRKLNINIHPDSIRRLIKILIDTGEIEKGEKHYWRTTQINEKRKEQIPINTPEEYQKHINYREKRFQIIEYLKNEYPDLNDYNIDKLSYQFMWSETQTVYYPVKSLIINGIQDEDFRRICELSSLVVYQ